MATRILKHPAVEIANLRLGTCWGRGATQRWTPFPALGIIMDHSALPNEKQATCYLLESCPDFSLVTQPSSTTRWINVCSRVDFFSLAWFCFVCRNKSPHTYSWSSSAIDPLWSHKVSYVFLFTLPPPWTGFWVLCLGYTNHRLRNSSDNAWRLIC